jgi:Spy/CpxP family protein refolding chaperone
MIRRIRDFWMAAALIALIAARGRAQSSCEHCAGAKGPPALMLLTQPAVQQELKLSDEQIKKVGEALAQEREEFRKMRELPREEREHKFAEFFAANRKQAKAIVTPEQAHRLRQIAWQQQGAMAFGNPRVAEALHLSDEQKEKIKTIRQETRDAARKVFGQDPPAAREDARKAMEKLHKDAAAKMMALITPEQKEKWQALIGEPFTGAISGHHRACAQ